MPSCNTNDSSSSTCNNDNASRTCIVSNVIVKKDLKVHGTPCFPGACLAEDVNNENDVGNPGEMRINDECIYVCVKQNTWKKTLLTNIGTSEGSEANKCYGTGGGKAVPPSTVCLYVLREYFAVEFEPVRESLPAVFEFDLERIIDDFIFMVGGTLPCTLLQASAFVTGGPCSASSLATISCRICRHWTSVKARWTC